MNRYPTEDKDTGVIAYETTPDSIAIKFRDGSVYLYTKQSTGAYNIAQMKHLAQKGEGLTTYINQNIREKYEAKLS